MKTTVTVSICMATYNGEAFIKRQLDSILPYLESKDEVIIVDDGSTDQTVQIIQDYRDERVHLFVHQTNHGVINSFEEALGHAKNDVILLADQDDVWFEDKVENVKKCFEEDTNVTLVYHDAQVVDKNLKILYTSWREHRQFSDYPNVSSTILRNHFTGCMMAFKRELCHDVMPFPRTVEMHDQWIGLVALLQKRKIVYLAKPMMQFVRHGQNATGKKRTRWAQLVGRLKTVLAIGNWLLHQQKIRRREELHEK